MAVPNKKSKNINRESSSKSITLDDSIIDNTHHAQFLYNSSGKVEHVVLHVDDWERLAKLDPVYQAKNRQEGLQLNILMPEGKLIRLPHAVAVMMFKYGEDLLKAWRLYRGYKQSDFEQHGIKQPTMFQIEKSTRSRITTLEKLSEIYGCDIDQLATFFIEEKDKKVDM
ncbi:MAG: helix-turn-helix transcriptional regulator [Psychrobacter sp.]|nr:helix-turn-helix transcriptional regulator [Psychrobacter sp.]